MTGDPRSHYRERGALARDEASRLDATLTRLSRARVAAFLLAATAFLLLETSPRGLWPALIGAGTLAAIGFAFFVAMHRSTRRALDRARLRETIAGEGEARLDRDWERLPLPGLAAPPEGHPYVVDLDVLGPASLEHLLGRVTTDPGRAALRRALLDPFAPGPATAFELFGDLGAAPVPGPRPGWEGRIRERVQAIERLAELPELLEALETEGRSVAGKPNPKGTSAFLAWAGGEDWLPRHRWALPAAWVLAVAVPVSSVAWFLGWMSGSVPIVGMVAALALTRWVAPHAYPRYAAAEGGEGDPLRWSALLALARRVGGGGPLIERIRESDAEDALLRLRRLSDIAAIRHSSLAHFPLAALFAWDIHVLSRLERWRQEHGGDVDTWVRAVAELELTASLAGLRHDHPSWSFAALDMGEGRRGGEDGAKGEEAAGGEPEGEILGKDLRHPLLGPDEAVANTVRLPAPGRILLVTGSNMSGKSTLLRALGTNQLLALIGAPVAAGSFATRPLLPWTSMRVSDSLSRGVSYFLAELHRLKAVVDAAREGPVFYLLDEILQGTNTAERRTAARIVLSHLLETGAVGAVTTHDLTLVDAPELASRSENVHFREDVLGAGDERRIHFDHLLREGPATSRNALLLLEMVGLGAKAGGIRAGDDERENNE